jgi:hypothetical protein
MDTLYSLVDESYRALAPKRVLAQLDEKKKRSK